MLAHCSAAVRPRSDIKARAYNLVLELSNRQEADDVAALLEDREGARALMRATSGDPEDVTKERLPYILEQVRLAAGEFAAAKVREEGQQQLDAARAVYATELEQVRRAAGVAQALQDAEANRIRQQLLQQDQDAQWLAGQNATLQAQLAASAQAERARQSQLLQEAFQSGRKTYRALRWAAALAFGLLSGAIAWVANKEPALAAAATVLLGTLGFWFVPDFLDRPMQAAATKRMRAVLAVKDKALVLPTHPLDFKQSVWGLPES